MGTIAAIVSIAGGIVAIIATVGALIVKLTSAITALTTVVAQLKEIIDSDRCNNEKAHEHIYHLIDCIDQKQNDAAQALTRLETLEESRGNK